MLSSRLEVDSQVCGGMPQKLIDVLLSDGFRKLVGQLRVEYGRIVFDSPPVGKVPEALALVCCTDYTVFVVRAGRSSKRLARKVLGWLGSSDRAVVGRGPQRLREYKGQPRFMLVGFVFIAPRCFRQALARHLGPGLGESDSGCGFSLTSGARSRFLEKPLISE